jgi:hypothetical protein
LNSANRLSLKTVGKPDFCRAPPDQSLDRLCEQSFACSIHETKLLIVRESKDGNVDLPHHCAEQGSRFKSAQSLFAKYLAEIVDLDHRFAKRIVVPGSTSANREVTFPQRGKEVRHCLKRIDDALASGETEAKPAADNQDCESPLDPGCVRAAP